jgi:major membrane immunogen (membrane-anchored lipoprotein)
MTVHAVEEMAEDKLDKIDVEISIQNGRITKIERNDPRGARQTIHGTGADRTTQVGTVGRFTGTGRYLIVTVYKVTEA